MMKKILAIALLLLLVQSSWADELWVRNRPFKGAVRGSGNDIQVELAVFLKTLELEAEDQGDVVIVGGFPIPVDAASGVRLVPLRDMVDAAGLKIHKNAALGTIDVRVASAGEGSRGDWAAISSGTSSKRSKGTKAKLAGAKFSLTVPGQLEVLANPTYLKSKPSANVKLLPQELLAASGGLEPIFTARRSGGPESAYLTLGVARNLGIESAEEEKLAIQAMRDGATSRGVKDLGEVISTKLAGKKYYKFSYSEMDAGVERRNEAYVLFAKGQAFMFSISAQTNDFKRVAPQFRLVVRNLRTKR